MKLTSENEATAGDRTSKLNLVKFEMTLKINEIFFSIQGESSYAGYPTVFIRTTGCNLRCTYCDTKYSYFEGTDRSFEELLIEVQKYSPEYICITGGEPLLQPAIYDFMQILCEKGFKVSLETSGSRSCEKVDPRVKVILDVKTPDSGASNSFDLRNLGFLKQDTEVKFVICSEDDFEWSESFCQNHGLYEKCQVLFSPSHGALDPKWVAEKILATGSKARLQLQLHKYIWSPNLRGV